MVGIYKITSPSGKIYIGQSWDITTRLHSHRHRWNKRHPKLYASLSKYGRDNHKYEILHLLPTDVSQQVLSAYECTYIDFYKSAGFELLNLQEGGIGGKHSEESKKKISKGHTGKIVTQETRAKMSANRLGKKRPDFVMSEAGREGLRRSKIGNKNRLGIKHTEATKIKMSQTKQRIKNERAIT